MALFDVPGWSVPSEPLAKPTSRNKKRKRPNATPAEDDTSKVRAAQVNVERLMEKLDAGAQDAAETQNKKKRRRTSKAGEERGKGTAPSVLGASSTAPSAPSRKQQKKKSSPQLQQTPGSETKTEGANTQEKKKRKQKEKGKAHDAPAPSMPAAAPKPAPEPKQGLTALQANMKNSLDGARFRWINEILYKSDSEHAHQMMRENPKVYEEYHTGFRHQVHSWPTNPVSHYISALSSYPPKTVIADLGCGDAALARALVPKGMTVLSFDLVSDGVYVVEADTCSQLPLPGSEGTAGDDGQASEGEGHVVDVVTCALSLMGTNWPRCIREAWRVLKPGGELKIAEVASRFTDVDDFASLVSSIGFRLKSKDDSNTHFTLFEFKKVARKPKSDKEWEKILSRNDILKPCEYKRR